MSASLPPGVRGRVAGTDGRVLLVQDADEEWMKMFEDKSGLKVGFYFYFSTIDRKAYVHNTGSSELQAPNVFSPVKMRTIKDRHSKTELLKTQRT